MLGKLDSEVIEKFKIFQEKSGKYGDLDIESVKFEKIALSDERYFEFIKGKNKYIQRYIKVNKGDYPILGSSLKNSCISAYIKPIDKNDIVNQKSVTFNKDNAKGSVPFFRDYPYLMDRHHIAIIPNDELVDAKYLEKSLIRFFEQSKFGWGENVADVPTVSKHQVSIPKDLNKTYTSYKLQEIIVEFLEYNFDRIERIRKNIDRRYDLFKQLRKSLIPSTFIKDYIKVAFGRYAREKGIKFEIIDIEFHQFNFDQYISIQKGKSKYTGQYIQNNRGKYPVYSSNTNIKTKGLMGSINSYDYDEESIQFTANGEKAGTIFKLDKHKFSMNGDRGMFQMKGNQVYIDYIYYNIKNEFFKHKFSWANKPTNTKIKENIIIYIPKKLEKYTSIEIQKIIADFIEYTENRLQKEFDKMDEGYEALELLHKTYLARTFSLIEWEKEDG